MGRLVVQKNTLIHYLTRNAGVFRFVFKCIRHSDILSTLQNDEVSPYEQGVMAFERSFVRLAQRQWA
jgi:hypothetical protein